MFPSSIYNFRRLSVFVNFSFSVLFSFSFLFYVQFPSVFLSKPFLPTGCAHIVLSFPKHEVIYMSNLIRMDILVKHSPIQIHIELIPSSLP